MEFKVANRFLKTEGQVYTEDTYKELFDSMGFLVKEIFDTSVPSYIKESKNVSTMKGFHVNKGKHEDYTFFIGLDETSKVVYLLPRDMHSAEHPSEQDQQTENTVLLVFGGILLAVIVCMVLFFSSGDDSYDDDDYDTYPSDSELQDLNTDGQVDMNDAELYIDQNLNK